MKTLKSVPGGFKFSTKRDRPQMLGDAKPGHNIPVKWKPGKHAKGKKKPYKEV